MTRSELTIALANRFPQLVMKDIDISVKEILDKIGETLAVFGNGGPSIVVKNICRTAFPCIHDFL
jgi:hypothetical protein